MKKHRALFQRFVCDERGGAHTLEWLGAAVLVFLLVSGIELFGSRAYFRMVGVVEDRPARSQPIGARPSKREPTNNRRIGEGAEPPESGSIPVPPRPTNDNETKSESPSQAQCEEGFFEGALAAFMQGEGEIFGDLIGVRDADLKRHLWDRRAQDVLADVARGTMEITPGLIAAAPSLITSATSNWDTARAAQAGGDLLKSMFVDSIDTGRRLVVDGWHGGGVMIAAVQRGDCVAFGQTLRSGVNNAPEAALVLLDVVPMGLAATKLGKGAFALGKATALAKAAAALANATSMGAGAAKLAKVAFTMTTAAAAKGAADVAVTMAAGKSMLTTAAATIKTSGLGQGLAGALLPRPLLHMAQEVFVRGGAAVASAKTAVAASAHTLIDGASTTVNHIAHALSDAMNGGLSAAHAGGGGLDGRLLNSTDKLPWESGLLLGAVRSPREILRQWPHLRKIPSQFMLFVWDLAQPRRRDLDDVLGRANQLVSIPRVLNDEASMNELVLDAVWRRHGKLVFERRFSQAVKPSGTVPTVFADGAATFTDPPDSLWMGLEDWVVHGRDLREIDPDAHRLLQQTLSWTPDTPDPAADIARVVRAASLGQGAPPSDAARVLREISLGNYMANRTRSSTPSRFLREKSGEILPVIEGLTLTRTMFDNAARSVNIAYIQRNRGLFFGSFPVRPELVTLVNERPIALHLVNEDGVVRSLPTGTAAERSLREGFVHQARAEDYLSRTDHNFVTELRDSGMRIEVYGRAVEGQDGIRTGARYLPWLDEDDKGWVLNLIEVVEVGSRNQLPFTSATNPLRRSLPVLPGDTVLEGLPTDDASFDAIIQFHQFLNNEWRRFGNRW